MTAVLARGGRLGALIAGHDWALTSLGPLQGWPPALRTAAGLVIASPVPMVLLWGADGVMIFNDAYAEFAGPRYFEQLGAKVREGWPEVADFNDNVMQVGLAGGMLSYRDQELRLVRSGRPEQVWMNLDYSPVHDESGAPAGVLAIVAETTGRVRAERRAQADRERLHLMLQRMPGFAGLLTGPEHVVAYVNDAFEAVAGKREIVGRPIRAVLPELAGQGFFEPLDRAYQTREPFAARALPIRLERVDGERFVDVLYQPIEDEAGGPTSMFIGGYDVTALVRAQEAFSSERDRLAAVLDGMGEGFGLLDPEFRILTMNAEGLRLDSRPREALIGLTHWEAYPGSEESALGRVYKQAMRERVAVSLEHRYVWESGREAWLEMRAYPVADGLAVFWREIADRKRAEAERDRAAALLRTFIAAVPGVVYAKDRQGRMLVANAGTEAVIGKGPELFIGRTDAEFLDDRSQAEAIMATDRRIMDTGTAEQVEEDVRLPDGTPAIWLSTKVPLRDDSGQVIGLIGSSVDITARKVAEAALRYNEERLRFATEAADVGFWDVDMINDVLFWPPLVKAMFGVSATAAVSMRDFYEGLHPEDLEATTVAFIAACDPAARALYDVEYRTVGKEDGLIRWVAAKGRGSFDERGRCVRVVGTAIDVTARKQAEARQKLRLTLADTLRGQTEPRTIMQAAVDALGGHLAVARVGYGLVQADGRTVELETEYVSGVAPLAGRYLLDTFGAGNIEHLRAGRTSVYADVEDDTGTAGLGLGKISIVAMVAVPLRRDDRLRAIFYVHHGHSRHWSVEEVALIEEVAARVWDAVERALADDALRTLNGELAQRVEKAVAELRQAEEQLRQSQKMEAVGQLTGGIAHDFNNMLAVVIGSLDLLNRWIGSSEPRAKRYVEAATEGARRAALLTQRLLAFSRQQPLRPEPVDANRLVAGMSDLLRHSLGVAVQLETVLGGGLWQINVDPNQLENLILNLAVNARDAMPDGGRLTIETQNAHLDASYVRENFGLAPGQYVLIAVTDTGVGMTPDVIVKAFDPFFTTKEVGKGTGLGLRVGPRSFSGLAEPSQHQSN